MVIPLECGTDLNTFLPLAKPLACRYNQVGHHSAINSCEAFGVAYLLCSSHGGIGVCDLANAGVDLVVLFQLLAAPGQVEGHVIRMCLEVICLNHRSNLVQEAAPHALLVGAVLRHEIAAGEVRLNLPSSDHLDGILCVLRELETADDPAAHY